MRHFTDTYERNAYTVSAKEVGMRAMIDSNGSTWKAITAGTGAANWQPVAYKEILISLNSLREVTSGGDPGNVAAHGGLLASDTTPILRGDAAETLEVAWAAGNSDIVGFQTRLPDDLDDGQDVLIDLDVLTDNAGGGGIEAATFTVETGWDGGALVSDTATDATPAITLHTITATVAAADVPASPKVLTCMLTLGTHANDPVQLLGIRIRYFPKAPTP